MTTVGAIIKAVTEGTIAQDRIPTALAFYTHPDNTNNAAERMRMTNSGNVGVNNTNPQGMFQVGGGSLTVLSNGKVGINTTSPQDNLDVNGGITSTYSFFHDRGDSADYDFTVGDFTIDNNWHDLDLSSIVPIGTKSVLVFVIFRNTSAGQQFRIRKNGNSNIINVGQIIVPVSDKSLLSEFICPIDSNRIVEYIFSNSGTWDAFYLYIKGCWK